MHIFFFNLLTPNADGADVGNFSNQTPPTSDNHAKHIPECNIRGNFFVTLGNNDELCFLPKPLKATITRTDPNTKKNEHFSLTCESHENFDGEIYLINTVTEANVQQQVN